MRSILFAVLHIAREQFKVVAAFSHFSFRVMRVVLRRFISKVKSRQLTLVIYGLFITLTLKFFSLTASIFSILQPPVFAVQLLDATLISLVLMLVYLLGAIVHPLISMERHENKDILKFGDDFSQLLSLRGAIESMPEAFSLWDRNRKLVLSNSKFENTYHFKGCETVKTDEKVKPDYFQFDAKINQLMMRPIRANRSFTPSNYETQMRNGRWLQIQETPTVDGGLMSVSFDITKLKTSQQNLAIREQQMCNTVENLRESRRELEQKTQKLAELADKYMREKERAEDANRVKSEFLANISHELRTPLNAIIGFSDMMHREVLGPIDNAQYADYINDINMSGAYLLELINDILDMSRIEAGRLTLETKPCSLRSLLDDCIHIVSAQAEAQKIELLPTIPKDVEVVLDQRAIKQVMLNLMSNAIKFTPEGGTVELLAEMDQSSVHIYVKDTGIGIEENAISKLGKPFQQVENQLTKCHSGTGLGLAISRSLVDLHGGHLSIESEVGVGTTVLVTLPLISPTTGQSNVKKDQPLKSLAA
jgi:two-component system cell cycle sensor histidine kinase PleC